MITLADLITALTDVRHPWETLEIQGATIDSREVIPGGLFVALQGDQRNGHDYVGDAFQRGAQFALIDQDVIGEYVTIDLRKGMQPTLGAKPPVGPICIKVDDSLAALQQIARYWRNAQDIRVVGITGSVGKSTTKEIAAAVLSQRYKTLKNYGNLNNEIGLPLSLLSLSQEHKRAVLEMGLYVPGEIAFLCDIAKPHVGVITNVGTVHAERAGTQEAIAKGKAELVEALPQAPEGTAILNYDDPMVREMAKKTKARVIYYGLDSRADLWADNVEGLGLDGIRLRLHYKDEFVHIKVPMIGRHSVHTALRASAVGLVEGLTWQEIVEGLKSGESQLRMVVVRTETGATLIDDTYNASPQSMLAALNLLTEIEGRKVAVLGDMLELGRYEWQGHEKVGVRAAEVADEIITVGERGRMIAAAAYRSGFSRDRVTELEDSDAAIEFLKGCLKPDDVVLVKGSHGMRMDKIVYALEKRR